MSTRAKREQISRRMGDLKDSIHRSTVCINMDNPPPTLKNKLLGELIAMERELQDLQGKYPTIQPFNLKI